MKLQKENKMRFTLTFKEVDYEYLLRHLFTDRSVERAAYALCRIIKTDSETRLLVNEIIPVLEEDIESATETSLSIKSRSFLRAMKQADLTKRVFVFIHSHPETYVTHSEKDDTEELKLFKTAYTRIKTPGVHGSLVLSSPDKPIGRVWLEDGHTAPISLIRSIGSKFKFFSNQIENHQPPSFFDRQVRAFGEDIQNVLQLLHIGVVGAGGTGSSVIEQLVRLGIGTLTIIDGQTFEQTNVNRVYGSSLTDDGLDKVEIAKCNSDSIGLGTVININNKPITVLTSAEKLKNCDIVFGCTDDHSGRSILNRIAVYYSIPVFDMGVKIDSEQGTIRSIQGRITTLLGGYACLFCRGRISPKRIQAEILAATDPEALIALQKEGYADELETPAPSVIPFTTSVASSAVAELLHRLTGYMGEDRKSNEVIIRFDENKINTNRQHSREECFCGQQNNMNRGDTVTFLDKTWS